MTRETYILAGGGTGGHLCPALAVAEAIRNTSPRGRIVFACSDRAIDRRILDPQPYAIVPQPVRPLPRALGEVPAFLGAWRRSKALARQMVRDLAPAAVLGLGGFAAAPLVLAAAKAGIRTALLNPDAVPGKANKHLAKHVDVIFTQFDATAECFPRRIRRRVYSVGCPIRGGFVQADRAEAMEHFGLRPDRKTLLINGGSLGAEAINDAISALAGSDALAELSDLWQVLHVTGPSKALKPHQVSLERIEVRRWEWCDRMDLAYAAADLAVCRGGASTVAELPATRTPAVILPYPYHSDNQQGLNAQALANAGAVVICPDARKTALNVAALRRVLVPILRDPPRLQAMSIAAGKLAKPRAAGRIARWLCRPRRLKETARTRR